MLREIQVYGTRKFAVEASKWPVGELCPHLCNSYEYLAGKEFCQCLYDAVGRHVRSWWSHNARQVARYRLSRKMAKFVREHLYTAIQGQRWSVMVSLGPRQLDGSV